jgi:hypothetical protein
MAIAMGSDDGRMMVAGAWAFVRRGKRRRDD